MVPPERASVLADALAKLGFTTIKEVRTGFPPDEAERAEMANGLVREILPEATDHEELALLLDAVAAGAMNCRWLR